MRRLQDGFTLIELMIAVAIVGTLATIALPAYRDYTIRSRLSEALAAAGACKTSVAEFAARRGRLPEHSDEAGCGDFPGFSANSGGTQYVHGVLPASGGVILVLTSGHPGLGEAGLKLIVLTPTDFDPVSLAIGRWTCGAGENVIPSDWQVPAEYLPSSC